MRKKKIYEPTKYKICIIDDPVSEDVISPEMRKKENYYIKKIIFKLGSIKEAAAGAGWSAEVMNWNIGKIAWGVMLNIMADYIRIKTRNDQIDLMKELMKR